MAGVGCHTSSLPTPGSPSMSPNTPCPSAAALSHHHPLGPSLFHPPPSATRLPVLLPPQHFTSPSPIFGLSSPCRPSTDLQEGVELALVPHEVRQVADEAEPLLVGGLVVRVVRVDA